MTVKQYSTKKMYTLLTKSQFKEWKAENIKVGNRSKQTLGYPHLQSLHQHKSV